MDLSTTTAAYGHKLVFLFVGGFLIALAIEKWHLHKRLALNIIRVTGSNKSRVILGFMLEGFRTVSTLFNIKFEFTLKVSSNDAFIYLITFSLLITRIGSIKLFIISLNMDLI